MIISPLVTGETMKRLVLVVGLIFAVGGAYVYMFQLHDLWSIPIIGAILMMIADRLNPPKMDEQT